MTQAERAPEPGRLRMSLDFLFGRGFLTLRRHALNAWGQIPHLRLEIPDLRFPIDMQAGAERFAQHRNRIVSLRACVSESELSLLSERLVQTLPGVQHLHWRWRDGEMEVQLETTAQAGGGRIVARYGVLPPSPSAPGTLRFLPVSLLAAGAFPRPPSLLITQTLTALLNHSAHPPLLRSTHATSVGDEIQVPALELLCAEVFSRHGWKLPAREEAELEAVELRAGQLTLDFVGTPSRHHRDNPSDGPTLDNCLQGARATRALAAAHERSLLRDAERAFFAEDLDRAMSLLKEAEGRFGRSELVFSRQVEILLHESRAHGLEDILMRCEERLHRDPDDVPALAATVQVAQTRERRDDERAARDRLLRALEAAGRHAEHIMTLLDAMQREHREDPGAAIELARTAVRLAPRHPSVLRLTADLARRAGDMELLEETLGRSLRMPRHHGERILHGLELADLLSQRHHDHTRALDLLRGLPTTDEHRPALLALSARIAERAQRPHDALRRWTELAELHAEAGNAAGEAQGRGECARLWMTVLEDPASALTALLQAVERTPNDRTLHAAIVHASLAVGDFRPALVHGDLCLGLLEATTPRSTAEADALADERADLLEALGDLHLRRGHPEEAARMWRDLLTLRPHHERAWTELEAHLNAYGKPESLLAFYEEELQRSDNPTRSARLLRAMARVLDEGLGLSSQAIEPLRRALHLQPEDVTLLEALNELLERRGEPGRLLSLLDEVRHVATSREALTHIALLRSRAAVRAQRPRLAREAAAEGLRRMPAHLELLRIARDHSAGDQDAEPFLLALADVSPEPQERDDARERLATLAEARGDQVDAARWRDADPGPATTNRPALQARDTLDTPAPPEASPAPIADPTPAPSGTVEPLETGDRTSNIPRAQKDESAPSANPPQRLYADEEAVDELGDTSRAARLDELTRRADRYRAQREHVALCDLLPELVTLTDAPHDRAALLNELGQVLHHDLEETARARPFLEEARRLDPEGIGRDFALVSTLEGIYEDLDEPDGLFEMYAHRLAEAGDDQMRNVYRLLMATTLWERLGRPDDAMRLLREVLEHDPNHLAALRLQAEVLESRGDFAGASASLRAIVAAPDGDPFEVQEVLRILGRLEWRALQALDDAATRFQRLLDEIPGDTESISALKQIHVQAGHPERAVEVVLRELGILLGSLRGLPSLDALLALTAEDVPEALHATFASIVLEIPALLPDAATDTLHELLRVAEHLCPDEPQLLEARVVLYRKLDDGPRLAEALERLAGELLEGTERRALLEEAAQLWEAEGAHDRAVAARPAVPSDLRGTVPAFANATDGAPQSPVVALDQLVAQGRTEDAIAALDALLPDTRTPDARRELLVRKGRWVLDLRPQAGEALLLLKGALIFDESAADTRLELARAQAGQGDLRGALEQLRCWSERAADKGPLVWEIDGGAPRRWRQLARDLSSVLPQGLHAWLAEHHPHSAVRLTETLQEPIAPDDARS